MDPVYHLIYEGEIYSISPSYYESVLEYLYYDTQNRDDSQKHPQQQNLSLDQFKARYDYLAEQQYLSQVIKFNEFVERSTYAIHQSAISSRLDKLVPKPTFLFTHSLLELDHWCKVVVRAAVRKTLESLDINLEELAKHQGIFDNPGSYYAQLAALTRLEESFAEESHIWETQRAASTADHLSTHNKLSPDSPHFERPASLQSGSTENKRIEAFCNIVTIGIEKFEPVYHHLAHHSKRHLYVEAFKKCKRDLIAAITKCIPDSEIDTRPKSHPERFSTGLGSSSPVVVNAQPFKQQHTQAKSWSNSISPLQIAPPNFMVNGTIRFAESSMQRNENKSSIPPKNPFSILLDPASQTSLAQFLELLESCRRRTLGDNNPLPPASYYFVDAGYLPDPRLLCKLSVPKKVSLRQTIEFHTRLLQKEIELGYFKNVPNKSFHSKIMSDLDLPQPPISSITGIADTAAEFSDPTYNPYTDPSKLTTLHNTGLPGLLPADTLARRRQATHRRRTQEANMYGRYYSMLAYAVRVHYLHPTLSPDDTNTQPRDNDYAHAREIVSLLERYLLENEGVDGNGGFSGMTARRREVDFNIAQILEAHDCALAEVTAGCTLQLQQMQRDNMLPTPRLQPQASPPTKVSGGASPGLMRRRSIQNLLQGVAGCLTSSSHNAEIYAPESQSLRSPYYSTDKTIGFEYDARDSVYGNGEYSSPSRSAPHPPPPPPQISLPRRPPTADDDTRRQTLVQGRSTGALLSKGLKKLRSEKSSSRLNSLFNGGDKKSGGGGGGGSDGYYHEYGISSKVY
ncbi:uncharacterized protein SAPINGB_P002358 [Magnusiomyces paraingens]|uniref:Uncharacterized protein n=1 Tax=Magnusiomyces paraingens TaxID=2606893 RepID=A0A5E8BJB9_9ASCO|nr:uncharacterized protein SAPINGB_P002358 [Saprochaete ingens]VVT49617.1 unnamed protein product [Saprochaete ingens]